MSTRRERIRWFIANLVNRLPFTAWCNLVDWALEADPERYRERVVGLGEPPWRLRSALRSGYCRNRSRDFAGNQVCYCGKFVDGKTRRPESEARS
ncbi:MAG TPA: hypothetical protein VMT27_07695 [Actinomycetes bacterium]|nr:hypothetical protein [Actinomycetes bacterium]